MTEHRRLQTRRGVIVAALAAAGASASITSSALAASQTAKSATDDALKFTGNLNDWAFLVGSWSVRHRRLKERLAGSTEWEEFVGTCVNWTTLGGEGNVDDNVLELPSGTYRGVGMRAFDAKTRQWSIWWLDSRKAVIDPPVRGGFKNGVGTFIGDDTLRDRPVKVRFQWSQITSASADWEQAFSPDGGATWETNWRMEFTRVR